jgi:adenine-specific DNA-methyltransferase
MESQFKNMSSVMLKPTTGDGTREFNALMGDGVFDFPKPTDLIKLLVQQATGKDDIVLDFFAGSGPTGHAVLDLNNQDGGQRRFILVQLPEPTDRKDFTTIAEITKERIRRVIKTLNKGDSGRLDLKSKTEVDLGFRVFKLSESNFKPWDADVSHDPEALKKQLELHVDHVLKGRTPDDLLAEILLKSGFLLTTHVEKVTLAGLTVYSVADGALFICLEDKLTLELIRAMADRKPERVVCLDQGFAGADQLKANAVQIFKTKGVTSFKTV